MGFWRTVVGLVTGAAYRQEGTQYGYPGYTEEAAVPVTLDTALQHSAVWAATKLIAENVGSLPIKIWKVDPKTGAKEPYPDHPLALLFSGKVNRWQTRQEYFESLVYQNVLLGNDYSAVQRNGKGDPIALIPLMSEQMQVELQNNGDVLYTYTDGANVNVYSDKTIWHNKIFGNGIIGLSTLGYARNSIGIGQAVEKAATKVYKNGGKRSGVLSLDKLLTPDQRQKVKENFAELTDGNEQRLFVLEAGMKFDPVSMSPEDIELLASRRFQIEDIARFLGVPSILINDTAASTTWGSGIHQIVQGFYKLGLRPLLERYRSSMKARLLKPDERHIVDIEFDLNALLQPEFSERVKTGKESVQGGLMAPNEWRKREGMTPKDGGDKLLVQKQMVPIDKAGEVPEGGAGESNGDNDEEQDEDDV